MHVCRKILPIFTSLKLYQMQQLWNTKKNIDALMVIGSVLK